MSDLAYTARVTMHSAAWGDESGSVVTFKLPMSKGAEDQRNPFHGFTKRRKGKAGTRFMMVCQRQMGDDKLRQTIYEDEVMLAGWNDSQQNGHTAKFWIASDLMGHPFDGISRKEVLIVSLVELDDDNEPIDQKMRDRVEGQKIAPQSRLSVACAAICRNPEFWSWCQSNGYTLAGVDITDEEGAKLWFYLMCQIDSRAALDDPDRTKAIAEFEKIRKDFAASQESPF
jgi:hypothetical protein